MERKRLLLIVLVIVLIAIAVYSSKGDEVGLGPKGKATGNQELEKYFKDLGARKGNLQEFVESYQEEISENLDPVDNEVIK